MILKRGLLLCATLALSLCAWATEPLPTVPVLQLTGRPQGQCPDVVVLAPTFTESSKAYAPLFAQVAEAGTRLTQAALSLEDFTEGGPMNVLRSAGYQIIAVHDSPWGAASSQVAQLLDLRRKTRHEDGLVQAPICVVLPGEVSPADFALSLPPLLESEALLFLLSPVPELPLTVAWRNTIWPNNVTTLPVRPDHWVPTLSMIADLPPPANVSAVSILPTLTGVGYQRPLEVPEARTPPEGSRAYTLMCVYRQLPKLLPWVPDFSNREALLPSESCFLPSALPVSAPIVRSLSAPTGDLQGLYLRSQQRALSMTVPKGASCVVRLRGVPVLDLWEAEADRPWSFETPEEVTVEIFLLLPPGQTLAALDLFREPTSKTAP